VTRLAAGIAVIAMALAVSGCTNDTLAQQYRSGSSQNYISGDGTISEITLKARAAPVRFAGKDENGKSISSADYRGRVFVVNFWYAACPPCRAEAHDLEKTSQTFAAQGVSFLGVNVRDKAATALSFDKEYGMTYPSVLDGDSGALQLAFSGVIAPNAVPTTLVMDRQGRVAAQILGKIPDASTLGALITTVLGETSPTPAP
jgi:peroxiredoxin